MKKRKAVNYLFASLLVVLLTGYCVWAGIQLKTADADFRKFVNDSPGLFSPEIRELVDQSEMSEYWGRVQFLVKPLRNDITIEYTKTYEDGTNDYYSGLEGGLRAVKQSDGSWTAVKLRCFGPS